MILPATDNQTTIVRAIQPSDIRNVMRLIDSAWRVHLRIAPGEIHRKINRIPAFVAEDNVGLRGFMMLEPLPANIALAIAVGLRDTWNVASFLDVILPQVKQALQAQALKALVYIGNAEWLIDDLKQHGFATREWVLAYERVGTTLPAKPELASAFIRTAHFTDLPSLLALDNQVFDPIWHISAGSFSEALAAAHSFTVALVAGEIVAYQWSELYDKRAHLTRLAVHPDYQGQGIGRQLLYHTIVDVLALGANLITLNTQETNERSRALYEQFGFDYAGQRMPVLWNPLE